MVTIQVQVDGLDVLTSRETGLGFRAAIERSLEADQEPVVLDFSSIRNATQSCLDEMIGVLILAHGPDVLQRLRFRNCNPTVRSLIQFVIADRLESKVPAAI